jgi:hypothetical protein
MPNRKRLLARAPDSDKTEAGVKALVSVFFLFPSPLPDFVGGALAPKPVLPHCSTWLGDSEAVTTGQSFARSQKFLLLNWYRKSTVFRQAV